MAKKNPAVDAYITKAKPFAQPILKRLRTLIHKACPAAVEEIKWGAPFYVYQDRVVCATMGFKAHCALVFWKSGLIRKSAKKASGDLKRLRKITTLNDIGPDREVLAYIKLAMQLNEPTTKLPPREKRAVLVKTPAELTKALRTNAKAQAHFKAFTPSKKKDYIFWITGAKTEATRTKRLETAIKWIAEGKSRNWQYEAKKKKAAKA